MSLKPRLSSKVIANTAFALSTFCLTFLVAFIAGSTFFIVSDSSAESGGMGSAEGSTISMSTNAVNDEIILPIVPTPFGALVSDELIVTVSTDNPTGYTLKMNSLTDNTDLVNVLDPNQPNTSMNPSSPLVPTLPVIASTSAPAGSPAILSPNTWGYTLDTPLPSTPTFSAIPTFSTPEIIKITEEPIANSTTTISFAANANNTLPAGTYTGTIVFTATANPLPTPCGTSGYECILFTIDTADGTYSIPTSGRVANMNHTYDWDVYVDGALITDCPGGNCTGTSDNTNAPGVNGIALTGLSNGEHQIKIVPHSTPAPGWGNAFGHYNGSAGANAQTNKGKLISLDSPLTTMAFAPKTTESTTNASYMFFAMFHNCINLTAPATFIDTYKLPSTITNLSYFAQQTYYNNTSLTTPLDLTPLSGWLSNNTSITNLANFLSNVHYDNTNLTTPINLTPVSGWFSSNTSITRLDQFLSYGYHSNDLITPIDLTPISGWFSANNSITNLSYFLHQSHYGNTNLTTPLDLTPISGWFSANTSIADLHYFLSYIHYNNDLATDFDLAPISGWFNANNSITDLSHFLNSSLWRNDNISTALDLAPLTNWFNINTSIVTLDHFLFNLHYGSSKLINPVDLTPLTGWFNANNSVRDLSNFLTYIHYNNANLAAPINLTPITNWFSANTSITDLSYFLAYTHNGNTTLTIPINLTPITGWFSTNTSITDLSYFLAATHFGNTNLANPINFTSFSNWFSSGRSFTSLDSFLYRSHSGNTNLTLTSQTILPNWMKTVTEGTTPVWNVTDAFYQMFRTSSAKAGDTGEPRFQDNSVLSSIGTPPTNRETFANRSGITPLTSNWK